MARGGGTCFYEITWAAYWGCGGCEVGSGGEEFVREAEDAGV